MATSHMGKGHLNVFDFLSCKHYCGFFLSDALCLNVCVFSFFVFL